MTNLQKTNYSLFDIFSMGVDYGQLLAEEERDNEDWCDAFQGVIVGKKYSMPSQIAPRRQARTEKWRQAKRESYKQFLKILVKNLDKTI